MRIAQRIFQLIDRDRQVRPVAEPRRNLRSETRLLQLLQQSADTAEIGLAKHLRQDVGDAPGPALPGQPPQSASQDASEYVAHENLLERELLTITSVLMSTDRGPRASRPHPHPTLPRKRARVGWGKERARRPRSQRSGLRCARHEALWR